MKQRCCATSATATPTPPEARGRQQHRRDRREHQPDRRDVLPVQHFAEPPGARQHAEHRDQHHRQGRSDRRQRPREVQPGRLREAEDQDRVEDDRDPDHLARCGPAVAFEHGRQHRHHERRQHRHPEHDRERGRAHLRAAQLLRAECPDRGGEQHAGRAPGLAGHRAEFVPEQQGHAERGRRHAGELAQREALSEHGHAPQRGEDRHRVAEDRRAPGRQRLDRDDRDDVPDDHVGEGELGELGPLAARDVQRHLQPACRQPQHRQPEPHRQRAERQRRVVRDAQLHHRPIQAPDERQQDQQRDLPRGELHAHQGCVLR